MTTIKDILGDKAWKIAFEVDPNEGGDGTYIRLTGDPDGFRAFARMMNIMADKVAGHESETDGLTETDGLGWHLAFAEENHQFEITNARLVVLDCLGSKRDVVE